MIADLNGLLAKFEYIGSNPDLVQAAQMWDGETEVDPVGRYLEQADGEREEMERQKELSAREYVADMFGQGSFSLAAAKERGLFKDGMMETANAVVTEPGVSFAISAQHSSPHRFKQFDLEHIGSGEGAQVYGWGVYFSTNWGVNRSYHNNFGGASNYVVRDKNGREMGHLELVELAKTLNVDESNIRGMIVDEYSYLGAKTLYKMQLWRLRDLIQMREEDIERAREKGDENKAKDIEDYIAKDRKRLKIYETLFSHGLYRQLAHAMNYLVDLEVEDGELLDWDKMMVYGRRADFPDTEPGGVQFSPLGEALGKKISGAYTGREIYEILTKRHGSPKAASEWLLAQGIKGIRYADGMSRRDAENKTYNYVVFDPEVIKVRKVADRKAWSSDVDDASVWEDWEDWQGSFSMVSRRLYKELHGAFTQMPDKKSGKKVWVRKTKAGTVFRICPYPDVLNRLVPWTRDVIAKSDVVKKLLNKHHFTLHDVARLPHALWDPIAVFRDKKSDNGFIVVTDIETRNDKAEVRKSLAALELKVDKNKAEITEIETSYAPNGTGKYRGLLDADALLYADEARAQQWAKEEGSAIFQLLTTSLAEPGSEVMLKENMPDVNFNLSDGGSFSMRASRERVWEVLSARPEEVVLEKVRKEFGRVIEQLAVSGGGEAGRLGSGAQSLGEVLALVGAVRNQLPAKYKVKGLLARMAWLTYWAEVVQRGEAVAAPNKFFEGSVGAVAKLARQMGAQGLTEQEVREGVAAYAGGKMGALMEGVARSCVETIEQFLKDRLKEKVGEMYERLRPKREPGKKWPKGKMEAEDYRLADRIMELMRTNDEKTVQAAAEKVARDMRRLDSLEVSEETEEERGRLNEEVFLVNTFLNWEGMGLNAAQRAAAEFEAIVNRGKKVWEERQAEEKAMQEYRMAKIRGTKGWKVGSAAENALIEDKARKGQGKKELGKTLGYGLMSFSHKLRAMAKHIGKANSYRMQKDVARMNTDMKRRQMALEGWQYETLARIVGTNSEEALREKIYRWEAGAWAIFLRRSWPQAALMSWPFS